MTFQNKKIVLVFAALMLLCVCGCVDTEEKAGTFRATYSWWVGTAAILGGLLLAIVGWLWKQTSFRGWVLFIFALVGTIGFAPFGFVDHVTVTEERLQTKWGFWMAPTLHDIAFDDVAGVNLTKEITRGRRGRHTVGFRPDLGNQGKLGVDDDFSLRLSVVPDPNDSEKAVIQSWLNGDSTAEISYGWKYANRTGPLGFIVTQGSLSVKTIAVTEK